MRAKKRKEKAATVRPDGSRRVPLILLVLAVLPFLNGLQNGYTLDDWTAIRDNARLESPARLPELLTTSYWAKPDDILYRPVTHLSFAVQRWILGNEAPAFRAGNIALHAIVTVLFFGWLLEIALPMSVAASAAALFAVMTIHTEAVTALVGRAEVLATFWVLATVRLWLRATRTRPIRLGPLFGALACYTAGLLTKESAAVAPGVLLLGELWNPVAPQSPPEWRTRLRRLGGWRLAAFLGPVLVVGLLRSWILRGAIAGGQAPIPEVANPLAPLDPALRVLNAINLLWRYGLKTVLPLGLTADLGAWAYRPVARLWDPAAWLGLGGLLVVLAASLYFRRAYPLIGLGVLLFLGTFLPASNIPVAIGTIWGERLAYLPSAGLAVIMAALIIGRTTETAPIPPAASRRVLLAGLLLFYGVTASLRNRAWRDDRALATDIVRTQPDSCAGHYLLAFAAYKESRLDEAAQHAQRAIDIFPAYETPWELFGEVIWLKGEQQRALEIQEEIVRRFPKSGEALFFLGVRYVQLGRRAKASATFTEGSRRFPNDSRFAKALDDLPR